MCLTWGVLATYFCIQIKGQNEVSGELGSLPSELNEASFCPLICVQNAVGCPIMELSYFFSPVS